MSFLPPFLISGGAKIKERVLELRAMLFNHEEPTSETEFFVFQEMRKNVNAHFLPLD